MKKEWFSSKELVEIEGLPSTIQGVNRKARAEKWINRKRSGIQGKALEYHIDSLPKFAKLNLQLKEEHLTYSSNRVDPLQIWTSIFQQLNKQEQTLLTTWLIRNGVKDLLTFIEQSEQIE